MGADYDRGEEGEAGEPGNAGEPRLGDQTEAEEEETAFQARVAAAKRKDAPPSDDSVASRASNLVTVLPASGLPRTLAWRVRASSTMPSKALVLGPFTRTSSSTKSSPTCTNGRWHSGTISSSLWRRRCKYLPTCPTRTSWAIGRTLRDGTRSCSLAWRGAFPHAVVRGAA